jgi:hypothetical protein
MGARVATLPPLGPPGDRCYLVFHVYDAFEYELLAVGKPIVSSALETILPFSRVVEIVRTPEQWMEALEHALNSGGRGTAAERRAVALKNAWDQRVDLLEAGLRKMIRSDVSAPGPAFRE